MDERTEAMIACLDKLKPEHRSMMQMKYFEKRGVSSIARKFGKSFLSTQSQILRLRQKLRTCIIASLSLK